MARLMRPCMALLLCGACAAQMGGPRYLGVSPQRAEVDGMRFILRLREDRAEAIRVSPLLLGSFEDVAMRAQIAVARASGCRPVWAVGDPSMIEVGLSCRGMSAPKKPKRRDTACSFLAAVGRECG